MFVQKKGKIIENIITPQFHFAKCNHTNCKNIYLSTGAEHADELGMLCPNCRDKSERNHVVQCSSCGTVLNFVLTGKKEKRIVFTIEKCFHCGGTVEDEWEIEAVYQPSHLV
ncbi:MAG: hypothetical protein C0425_11270 [Chlorobiaceae bacterium]|nr:hypothetical protein [Chlorobiaceae bacterium]MBA4310895.1 hypothetical protein [Chlorobiaceae bacterium]